MTPRFRLIGPLDPCCAWDGTTVRVDLAAAGLDRGVPLEGMFAGLVQAPGGAWLGRDPLGIGKLFWAAAGDAVELANRPARLTARGHALEDCAALPADTLVTYRDGDEPRIRASGRPDPAAAPPASSVAAPPASAPPAAAPPASAPPDAASPAATVDQLAASIRYEVERYVDAVLAARPGPAVVCLSGGLDSTSVAALVRERRDDVVGVTFDLRRAGATRPSDDFRAAETAARHLGIPLVPAVHTPESLFDQLDAVLVAGIDWRDFNVHAGLVNAGLALSIAELVGPRCADATVFTGDLVNELVADYHEETYGGRTYYRLPRLPVARTRAALVRGLATSHREVGVFGEHGLTVVQPYAVARAAFLRLPDDVLGPGPGKSRLYRAMFGERLPPSSYERPKTRAQTGSEEGERGVLAACADAGFDEQWLARRFARLHGVDDPGALTNFLRAGRYRTAVPQR